jgi:hypothetical protein
MKSGRHSVPPLALSEEAWAGRWASVIRLLMSRDEIPRLPPEDARLPEAILRSKKSGSGSL